MNFEKIEQAYTYLLENTQSIQNELSTNFYDALIEQNAMYLDGKTDLDIVKNNSKKLKELGLSKEEWRRAYQFLFMKLLRRNLYKRITSSHQMRLVLSLHF